MGKPSRREFLQAAALGAAGVLVATSAAQEAKPDIAAAEKNLAKPLNATAKEKLQAAIAYAETIRRQRMAYKLPENSEPCTRYVPGEGK